MNSILITVKVWHKILFLLCAYLFVSQVWALECQWWQTKYSAAIVDEHTRLNSNVREHPRKEYCRDKWKNADVYIKQFKDDPIVGWPNKKEIFKKWTRKEIQLLLEILSTLPDWAEVKNFDFRRAKESIHKGNAASNAVNVNSIVLYDLFFKTKNKHAVIIHEASHYLYQKLGADDLREFSDLSGWGPGTDKARNVYEVPPKTLIKPDSAVSKDEDFSNHVEEFYSSPKTHVKRFPKIHQFLKRRFK